MSERTDIEDPQERLERVVREGGPEEARRALEEIPPEDRVLLVSRLPEELRARLVAELPSDRAADLLAHLPEAQAVETLEDLDAGEAARILHELPSDEEADLLHELPDEEAEAILARMPADEAAEARRLREYADDTAGGLMATEFLAFPSDATVGRVMRELRERREQYARYDVQYIYVTDAKGRLVGVLRLRDLLLEDPERPIGEIMVPDPFTVAPDDDLDRLRAFFEEHPFQGAPVVDAAGHLVGVVRRQAVLEALRERSDEELRRARGVLREELRTMPLPLRARRRLAWLSLNIVLNLVAASIIALFQDTLAQVIALAVFLPIISDMSGCSGNQAVAVSLRELALGLVKPTEVVRVWLKEVSVGVVNGLVVGGLIGFVGHLYSGNPWFGVVVGLALALNTVVAVSIGGVVPLLLRRFGVDPGVASGPILTTITDMCGFFLVLGLATLFLDRLQGA